MGARLHSNRLSKFVLQYILELKYAALVGLLFASLILLSNVNTFRLLDDLMRYLMAELTQLGAVGIFLLGVFGNISLFIQVPYTLPLLSAAVNGATLETMLLLGFAAGIGSTVGKMLGYHLADRILAHHEGLTRNRWFMWMKGFTERHPRFAPAIIFIWAFSPLPDDTVIIPLAMIRYGARRLFVPLVLGKVLHSVVLAWLFFQFTDLAARFISPEVQTDLALAILIIFVAAIGYQLEKGKSLQTPEPATPLLLESGRYVAEKVRITS